MTVSWIYKMEMVEVGLIPLVQGKEDMKRMNGCL